MPDTPAESTNKSLVNRAGNSPLPSAQAAAALSEMGIDLQSSQSCEQILILVLLLEGITRKTISGDVLWFGANWAVSKGQELGLEIGLAEQTVSKFLQWSKVRKTSELGPLCF